MFTHAGFLGDVIVQLVSIPLLAVSLWSFANVKGLSERQRRAIVYFCCAVIAVLVIQLCPLPFEVPSIGGAIMKVLVTGAAGFIGFHTASHLLARGDDVVGLDAVNDYYDPALKEARLRSLGDQSGRGQGTWTFSRGDLADGDAVKRVFSEHGFDRVIHLAAQAGVRYSLSHPESYVQSNLVGFTNVLEACRRHSLAHLTYASTSSVYGANTRMFAIALWDRKERRLLLARDRYGVKPLYYSRYGRCFAFASEQKAILSDPAKPKDVYLPAMLEYFTFQNFSRTAR